MSTVAEKFHGLWELFIKEVLKFGIVGGLAFIVNASITWTLMQTTMQGSEGKAKFVAGVVATLFSWVVNRLWTFKDKRQDNKWREAVQFAVVNLIGIGVETGCVVFAKYVLGMTSPEALFIAGTIVGTVLGTVVRYFAYRFWVYGDSSKVRQEELPEEDLTREEQVGRFFTHAEEILTGDLDAEEILRRSRAERAGSKSREDRTDYTDTP